MEKLRNVLVDVAAQLLADPVERAAAQHAQGMRMADGSNSLTPLMMCMQRLVGRMEPYKGLIRLLSMILTASPLIDFDSAYVAREILERKLESKRDVYRYGVFQLILNHISYVELSTPYWLPMPQSDPWACTPSADLLGHINPIQDHGITLQYQFAAEQQDAW